MKRPTFHLRDVFWLVLVVAFGLGWWMDHDRIRREVQQLQAIPVKRAQANLAVAEAEFDQAKEIVQRIPGAISATEFRRCELQVEVAKAELETARARQLYP
jgi:multidrug resistance efflux pump